MYIYTFPDLFRAVVRCSMVFILKNENSNVPDLNLGTWTSDKMLCESAMKINITETLPITDRTHILDTHSYIA